MLSNNNKNKSDIFVLLIKLCNFVVFDPVIDLHYCDYQSKTIIIRGFANNYILKTY